MAKEYAFEFHGTKEDILNIITSNKLDTSYSGTRYFYLNDYLIKIVDGEIHFGVERGGHSGGYWFIPRISEFEDRIEFRGSIQHIGPEDDRSAIVKILDAIGLCLMCILLIPMDIVAKLYTLIEWIVRKICNRPKVKVKTTEDKLFDLMENHLGCVRK